MVTALVFFEEKFYIWELQNVIAFEIRVLYIIMDKLGKEGRYCAFGKMPRILDSRGGMRICR